MTDEMPTLFDNQPEPMKPWQGGPVKHDLVEGERLRDEAMTKVTDHAEVDYKDRFAQVVRDFVSQRREFTSEDVTARIGMPTTHPNAVGALTRSCAIRYGYRKVGRVKATRTNQHATEIAVWGPR
jgi:hypothetical protein